MLVNKSFSEAIKDHPEKYPYQLEKSFARILARIAESWGTLQARECFVDLLVDKRGDRKGFPPKIMAEILVLSELHSTLYRGQRLPPSRTLGDPQRVTLGVESTREFRAVLEARDIKFSVPEFFMRIAREDLSTIALFVNAGMNIDALNEQGWTPLMVALFDGREDIAWFLLKKGANVNFSDSSGYHPIHWAAFRGYPAFVDEIVVRGGNLNVATVYGWTALLQAAALGHVTTVEALLRQGAAPDSRDKEGTAALHKAAWNNHAGVVRALVRGGAERDLQTPDQSTALHIAARLGYVDIVEVLLEIGCNLTIKDRRGATALHWAAANNHLGVVEQLVSLKSPIAAKDMDGATPLVYAIRTGALDAARCLTRAGADMREIVAVDMAELWMQSNSGVGRRLASAASRLKIFDTGSSDKLHRCIEHNDIAGLKQLLDNNENVSCRDANGRTALEFAAMKGGKEIFWLLVERGAGRVSDSG